ncbi:MAG: oxidoreductase [Flavobacteriales bacterium]|nr:oxidoreductase [Flavobacteriales bacterium]
MSQWQLIFDAARCNSCNNCVLATKDEYLFNRHEGYSAPAPQHGDLWFSLKRHERGAAPMIDVTHYPDTCFQCADAPCIIEATRDAISQRADGVVIIDPVKAQGRPELVEACPYGKIHWNEEEQVAQKYSLDAHLLDAGWPEPRAVQVCPTRALYAVKASDSEMDSVAADEGLSQPPAAKGARSRLWFRNAEALTSQFLGGTVVRVTDGREDCVAGARVRLSAAAGATSYDGVTDAFGDFRLDGIASDQREMTLQVLDADGDVRFEQVVTMLQSRWVGVIEIG